MGSIPAVESDFFFVPHSCHVDQFPFHISLPSLKFTICYEKLLRDLAWKIRKYANFVSNLLVYVISIVSPGFSNSFLSRLRMTPEIVLYSNVALFSRVEKF